MKIHNCLPILISCLNRWTTRPTIEQFERDYAQPLSALAGDFFEEFYEAVLRLDWPSYRAVAIQIDPEREEKRLRTHLENVEKLFGFPLEGEILLMGSFNTLDGFAQFDRGRHRVYLGIDESHLNGKYIDILTVHELTHVARESRPEVWHSHGLDPLMPRADFLEYQPVIEHVMGEGFSCLVSELLVPGEKPWLYAYQNEESLKQVYRNSASIDRAIKMEIAKSNQEGDYSRLYGIRPSYAHYVWGWQWAKELLHHHAGGDPRKLVTLGSKELVQNALQFKFSL